ncbi:MAG: ABC transporter permease [Methanothrix sp.]|nr:ABC transporter permease [Methanothrix sp.]
MYIPYIFKEVFRRKSRTLTNVLTVAVIIAMLLSVTAIMSAYTSAIYLPFKDVDSDIILQKSYNTTNLTSEIRVPFGKGTFDDGEIADISTLSHVQDISRSLVLWDFDKKGFTSIEGIESDSAVGKKLGSWVTEGRFINGSDNKKAVLESHFAKFNRMKVGNNISLGDEIFNVVGILKIGEGSPIFSSNIYIKSSDAQRISGIEEYDQLYLKVDDLANEEAVKEEINQIDPMITAISGNYISTSLKNVVNIYGSFYWVGVGIMALITILVLFKVNAMALLERRRDIAILQSVGWMNKDITRQMLFETSLQTVLGFVLGAVTSFAVVTFLGTISIQSVSTGLESTPTTITMPLTFSLSTIAVYFGLIVVISLLVSYLLAKKVAAIKPSENLRSL